MKKKILILTADAGFGHRSAANAVAAAIHDRYGEDCEVEVINPMDDSRTPFFLRDSQFDYDRLVRTIPELYRFYYDASDGTVTSAVVESALILLLYETMRDVIRYHAPDVIVSTYPLYQAPLEAVFTLRGHDIPILTVVTDLATGHRLWFNKVVDTCLVPNEIVQNLALSCGMAEDQVAVTGIPVSPELSRDTRSQDEIRAMLGWEPGLTTFLAIGSRRVDRLSEALNVLNHFGAPLQLAIVAGRDQKLFEELNSMQWHVPVRIYDYVSNIPTMMRAADAVICKAGGLVVTESLAAGRPMILIDALPGQERGNAEVVVRGGAGDLALNELEFLETISHWFLDDGKLFRERAMNAALLGRPHAAYDIAELAYQAANRPVEPRRHLFSRRTLVDLFKRNKVPVGETKEIQDIGE